MAYIDYEDLDLFNDGDSIEKAAMDTSFPASLEIREGMIKALNEVVTFINSGDKTVDNVKDMALTRILHLLPSEYMDYCNVWARIKDIPEVALGPMLDYFAWKTLVAELAGLAELEESADGTSKERAAQLRRQLILPTGLDVNVPGHSVDRGKRRVACHRGTMMFTQCRVLGKRSYQRMPFGILLSCLCVFISGCVAPTTPSTQINGRPGIDCSQVTAHGMASLFSNGSAPSGVADALESMFGGDRMEVPQAEIVVAGQKLESTFYRWEDADASYQLTTLKGMPRRATATFKTDRAPSLARTLECLGEPDYYSARHKRPPDGQPVLGVDLFYTRRGIIVLVRIPTVPSPSLDSTPDPIQLLSGGAPVFAIGWVVPGDIKDMDWRSYVSTMARINRGSKVD